MNGRGNLVKRIGRTLVIAAMVGVGAQLVVPVLAHAKRAKCVAIPVPGQPGTNIVKCSTSRP